MDRLGTIKERVEREYGQPFWDVVKGYADDGESMTAVGQILGYTHPSSFIRHCRQFNKKELFKPWTESNSFRAAIAQPMTEACKRKFKESAAKWKQENLKQITWKGKTQTLQEHARDLGIPLSRVRARKRLGMPLGKILYTGDLRYYSHFRK